MDYVQYSKEIWVWAISYTGYDLVKVKGISQNQFRLLLNLVIEPLAEEIRSDNSIKCIQMGNRT